MEIAVDLELDLPKVWTCVAELVASTLYASAGKVSLDSLNKIAAPLLDGHKAGIFLVEILKQIIKEQTVRRDFWLKGALNPNFLTSTTNR